MGKWLKDALAKLFSPAVRVGDFSRVRKEGELDGDEELLRERNRTWRQMLKEDPWMVRLMTHVRFLGCVTLAWFGCFLLLAQVYQPKHPIFGYLLGIVASSLLYWLWIGYWYNIIEQKVFAEFRKRFGKWFHLR